MNSTSVPSSGPLNSRITPRLGFKTKMIVSFILIVILVSGLTALGLFSNLRAQVLDEFQLRANSTARLTALSQDGDNFLNILAPGDALYEQSRINNTEILEGNPEIIRLLLLRRDDQGFYVVMDPGEENAAVFGDRYPSGSVLEQHYDSLTTAFSDAQISTTGSNSTLSAYAPIFDSNGQKVGAAVLTLDASSVIQKQNQALTS